MIDLGKIGYKIEIDDRKYTAILKKMDKNAENSANHFAATFKKAFAALGGFLAFREGVQALRMFSDELANIKTIAGEYDTDKLRKEITSLSSTLGTSAELANALYFAYSAGVRGSEKEMARFVGQVAALAKTIGAQVTPTMDAVTTMMNAYGLEVKDAGMLTDWFYQIVKSGKTTGPELAQSLGQIAATAAASGISLDELGAALATLTTTMPTNIAVTSLAASIRSLMNPTDDVRKQAAALGIDLSMAAIKAKGFGGVMEEIYNKTQGRGDLIGRLFPAESSRAIMALAGTQLNTLKQNIVDFSNKGGAAAVAFQEKMQSLDERIKALQVTGQKLLTLLADMALNIVTLGGALNPLLGKFVELDESGLRLLARLAALVAGLAAVKKAASLWTAVQKGLFELAVKGGYEPPELKEAKARLAEEASLKRLEAIREAATARQLMRDKQEIASAKARAVAVEQANLQELRSRDAKSRAQYSAGHLGNMAGYASNPALAESEKRFAQLTREQTAAVRDAEKAQRAYARTRAASVATVRDATAAKIANTAATRTNAAATGLLARSMNTCKTAAKGLWAAMAANPLTVVLAIVGAVSAGIMILSDRMKRASRLAAEMAAETADAATQEREKFEGETPERKKQAERLSQLAEKQQLTNAEQLEAMTILRSLTGVYGDFGVTLDETTGKLIAQSDAFRRLQEREEELREQKKNADIEAQQIRLAELEKQYGEKFNAKLPWGENAGFLEKLVKSPSLAFGYRFGDSGKLSDFSDQQLSNMLKSLKGDDEQRRIIKDTLEVRKRLRESQKDTKGLDGLQGRIDADSPTAIRERLEAERELSLLRQKNALAADGELSKADEQALLAYEINNQMERLVELKKDAERAESAFGAKSKEHLSALNEQEKAQAKIYEFQNWQRQGRIDLNNEQRSLRQQLDMNKLIIKLRQDGEYSITDQIDVQNLKLRQMAENIAAAKTQAANLIGDAKAQMEVKISQLELDRLMAQLDLKKLKESGLKSNGGFSAELLNLMSGAQSPQREIADNTRKSLSETRKVRENLEKSPVLRYGSR